MTLRSPQIFYTAGQQIKEGRAGARREMKIKTNFYIPGFDFSLKLRKDPLSRLCNTFLLKS